MTSACDVGIIASAISRVSINAQTIARNAPPMSSTLGTSRNDHHVWTDWNSFTGMSTDYDKIKMLVFFVFLYT